MQSLQTLNFITLLVQVPQIDFLQLLQMFIVLLRHRLIWHCLRFLLDEVDLSYVFGVNFESGEVLEITYNWQQNYSSAWDNSYQKLIPNAVLWNKYLSDESQFCMHYYNGRMLVRGSEKTARHLLAFDIGTGTLGLVVMV